MKNGIWENKEVKDLFCEVEKTKEQNKSLREAFASHAQKYGRQPNSVRNYYYHEIDNLKKDTKRMKDIGIDLRKHEKCEIKYFSPQEEKELMKQIDQDVKRGVSVRKACLNLSGGDVELMLRYQNKYRNFLAKEKFKEKDNIITFTKKSNLLSESELQALFMGLVRLVKKTAFEQANEKFLIDCQRANNQLRKTMVELQNKERELTNLKSEFLKIKEDNEKLIEGAKLSRSERAEKLKEKLREGKREQKIYN